MKVFDIVCGICGSHDFKQIGIDAVCQGCGHVLTDDEMQKLLNDSYKDYTAESGIEKEPVKIKSSVNKVYYFQDPNRDGGMFIAAKTWKDARNMSLTGDYDMLAYISFTEIEGHLLRDENKKPYTTEYIGELELYQLDELKIPYTITED